MGVLGGRSFVATAAVLPAIQTSSRTTLAAIAALGGPVDDRWADVAVASYDDVIGHPDVAAVYLPLPNGMHEEWTRAAAAAGKHVLCEKPLAPTAAVAERMAEACRDAGVLLAEAWMTPFDPRWRRVADAVVRGEIGEVDRVDAAFTFTIDPSQAANYRWRPDQGGGALLDVGIYTLGLPVALWGADPASIVVHDRVMSETGVDARSDVELVWPGGQRARIVCSFVDDEVQRISVAGTTGTITATGDAFTGGERAIEHHVSNG